MENERRLWPAIIPRDLELRLADVMLDQNCGPDDLWFAINVWLTSNEVAMTDLVQAQLTRAESHSPVNNQFRTVEQSGGDMNLTRLIYASSHRGLDVSDFDHILQTSRANNVRDLITGALIISGDSFMQLIEGSRNAIGRCFMRIMQDQRHHDIQVISCGDVSHRLFHEWSMHLIEASKIKQDILALYSVNGVFDPALISEFAIEDLCRTLSAGNWHAAA